MRAELCNGELGVFANGRWEGFMARRPRGKGGFPAAEDGAEGVFFALFRARRLDDDHTSVLSDAGILPRAWPNECGPGEVGTGRRYRAAAGVASGLWCRSFFYRIQPLPHKRYRSMSWGAGGAHGCGKEPRGRKSGHVVARRGGLGERSEAFEKCPPFWSLFSGNNRFCLAYSLVS